MKKWIITVAVIVTVLTLPLFIFIPNTIIVSRSVLIENNLNGLKRVLTDGSNWQKWWPVAEKKTTNKLLLNGNTYTVAEYTISSIFIDVRNDNIDIKTYLTLIPRNADTVKLEWDATIPTSYNPIKRLQIYLSTKTLQHDFGTLLESIKKYYFNTANLYDLDIRRENVKNAALVSIADSSKGFPSSEKIYSLIDELRKYIASEQAVVVDSPMLNIYTNDSLVYITRVAIPTDRELHPSGKIQYRWMLGGGNILIADVKGDQKKADHALSIVENYVSDYKMEAPAIPFFTLVTNRMAEKDSTKWITRIYYPIMYYK